jgi:hypothetical protein
MDLTAFEQSIEDALNDCKGAVKYCAKSALTHLRKAWALKDIDLEMAIFRGITAEEEAASSLFYSLKNQRYSNANKIDFKAHTHKLALIPYIKSVTHYMAELNEHNSMPFYRYSVSFTEHNRRKALQLTLSINIDGRGWDVVPTPPLHFNISNGSTGTVVTFEKAFHKVIQGQAASSAIKYVKQIANQRNQLLYATERGQPGVTGDIPTFLEEQKKKVFQILTLLLLIDPWIDKGHSAFVQQALDGFLLLLEKIEPRDVTPPLRNAIRGPEQAEQNSQ